MSDTIRDEVILILADLSGSMAGASVSKINVQLSELLSELKDAQKRAKNSIRIGIMGFHDTPSWILKPADVEPLHGLPALSIPYDGYGLGHKSDYSRMLLELDKSLKNTNFLCVDRKLNALHILLLTDGCATDKQPALEQAIKQLENNHVFVHEKTKRYVISEEIRKNRMMQGENILKAFAGVEDHIISYDAFSLLLSTISNELTGTIQKSSVFD